MVITCQNEVESEKVNPNQENPKHLAWHETMELHELVAFQSVQLLAFKKKLPSLQDPAVRSLYMEAIQGMEQNLRELLQYYPLAPSMERSERPDLSALEAAHLLVCAKTSVRNYATAITETATPQLRETFQRHLLKAIDLHAKVFYFLYQRGLYPAYDLQQLLASDINLANTALSS
jgi:spore coat protein F